MAPGRHPRQSHGVERGSMPGQALVCLPRRLIPEAMAIVQSIQAEPLRASRMERLKKDFPDFPDFG